MEKKIHGLIIHPIYFGKKGVLVNDGKDSYGVYIKNNIYRFHKSLVVEDCKINNLLLHRYRDNLKRICDLQIANEDILKKMKPIKE